MQNLTKVQLAAALVAALGIGFHGAALAADDAGADKAKTEKTEKTEKKDDKKDK